MVSTLKKLYGKMKRSYLGELSSRVPPEYWSTFVCVGAASDMQYSLEQIIGPEKKRILIVGLFGGRDYFYLKTRGHEVHGLDLYQKEYFENVKIGNMEEKLPFPDKFFDYILVAAVLEHVPRDFSALENIRAALKDDGRFILRLPFYDVGELTHVHIYNYESTVRLLKATGFEIEREFFSPNLFLKPSIFNYSNHLLNAVIFVLTDKTIYKYTLNFLWKTEYGLSKVRAIGFRDIIWKIFPHKAEGLFVCKKTDKLNYLSLNVQRFGE